MTANVSSASVGHTMWHNPVVFGIRRMFYVCSPGETSFSSSKEVPDYVNKAVPYFAGLVLLEAVILILKNQKRSLPRPNDAFSSVGAGIFSLLPLVFVRNIEMAAYMWIHERFTIMELPWESPVTWWLAMLGVDMGYYWVHRFSHEVNFMWAAHQVHHSSEDYNLTTALRQSALQRYMSWVFYLPMAPFIPPSVFMVHIQLNLIYQFWIHTEAIKRLGPLEWILNTPSHHRVHHGRNRYCIDKNYAGVLIIWDRMFGTFEPERDDDEVVYGLVHPLASWDPIHTQLCHWKHILITTWNTKGFQNKENVFLNGPGWSPGKPRFGLIEDIPDIHAPQPRYNKGVSHWVTAYAWVHFLLLLGGHQALVAFKSQYQVFVVFLAVLYVLWTLQNIGYIFEQRWYAPISELARCAVYVVVDAVVCQEANCSGALLGPRIVFFLSMGMCLLLLKDTISVSKKKA